jgi:Dolichyl-phosphate-mannose-protein mannosyltransferase
MIRDHQGTLMRNAVTSASSRSHIGYLLICLGTFLICYLATKPYSVCVDDPITLFISAGWPDIASILNRSLTHSPLYFIAVAPLAHFGLWAIRAISLVAVAASIILIYFCGIRIAGTRAIGLTAGLVFATFPLTSQFMICGRPYGLETLFSAASLYLFWSEREHPSAWKRIGLGCTSGLIVHASYIGIPCAFVIVAAGALMARRTRPYGPAQVLVPFFGLSAPLLFPFLHLFSFFSHGTPGTGIGPATLPRDDRATLLIVSIGRDAVVLGLIAMLCWILGKRARRPLSERVFLSAFLLAQPIGVMTAAEALRLLGNVDYYSLAVPWYKCIQTASGAFGIAYAVAMLPRRRQVAAVPAVIFLAILVAWAFRIMPSAPLRPNAIAGMMYATRGDAFQLIADKARADEPVILMSHYPVGEHWANYQDPQYRLEMVADAALASPIADHQIIPAPGERAGFVDSDGSEWLTAVNAAVPCDTRVWFVPRVATAFIRTALERDPRSAYQLWMHNNWPLTKLMANGYKIEATFFDDEPGRTVFALLRPCISD